MELPEFDIKIDWEAYYENFKQVHGLDPITDEEGKYLWFPDGWKYSAYRREGPEYAPKDGRERLTNSIRYWNMRKKKLTRELKSRRDRLQSIREMAGLIEGSKPLYSAPLSMLVETWDEESGQYVVESKPLDVGPLEDRVSLLESLLEEATETLQSLTKELFNAQYPPVYP